MDAHAIDTWKDVARHLAQVSRPAQGGSSRMGNTTRITRFPRDYPDRFGGRWTDETSRFVAAKGGGGVDGLIMRLSHAVATNDPGAVRPVDRGWLIAAMNAAVADGMREAAFPSFRDDLAGLAREADAAGPTVDPFATVPAASPFAFTHEERRGTGTARVVAEGLATVRDAGPGPHRIVARLTTDDGHEVVLREVDGQPYRAVFRPGCWEPIGLPEFVEAAREGGPWPDDPFLPPRYGHTAVRGVHEMAEPPRKPGTQVAARDEAHRECLLRAGSLVVIDGVVHRPTGLPMLHLQGISVSDHPIKAGPTRLAFAWSLGDGLTSDSSQTPMPSVLGSSPCAMELWLQAQPKVSSRGTVRRAGDDSDMGRFPSCLSFPIGDVRQAVEFGTTLAGAQATMPPGTAMGFVAPAAPMAWFDPQFFAEDPLSTARALSTLEVGCYRDRLSLDAYEPASLLRLRRDLADGNDLDGAIEAVEGEDLAATRASMGRYAPDREVLLTVLFSLGRVARLTHERQRAMGEDEVTGFCP